MNQTDHFAKLEELFHAASALTGEQRARFVAESCAPELRTELEVLLRSDSRRGAFVDDPGNAHDRMRKNVPDPMLGERVGAYRLVERIAEGGMGVVYRASREDGAFSQQVAVKLMRGGLVTERQLRRFEHERRLLARLAHPNIARLYDGGTTERGAPYLAMEFIHGAPIDDYCEQHHLSIEQRVALFIAVCDAVHCAHRNLVIHRDLKPSNVLVDTHGQAKLLDFGVAKLVVEDDTGLRATETIARVFTPEYASPEQFSGAPLTTATDIYSLGVMLHVLITGVKPFETAGLSDPAFSRIVCEREPTRPSAIVHARATTKPGEPKTARVAQFASALGITREKLSRNLRGDLDRIVLMALRKEPERRYASVEQFASDLRRWTLGLPVIARPDTFTYRTTKFVRRNWLAVSLSTLAAVSLLGGIVVANHLRGVAERKRNEALADRDHARIEVESGMKSAEYLISMFFEGRTLDDAEREVAHQNALAQADVVRRQFAGHDHLRANLIDALGKVCLRLGYVEDADAMLNETYAIRLAMFGADSLEVALSLNGLGELAYARGQFEQARTMFDRALLLHRTLPPQVHTDVANAANNLAVALNQLGRYDESKALHLEALALRRAAEPKGLEVAESLNNLAGVLWRQNDLAAAEQAFVEAIEIRSAILGASAADTLQSQGNLAALYGQQHQWDRAVAQLEPVAAGYRALGSAGEEGLTRVLLNLGDALAFADRIDDAEPVTREAVELAALHFGESHRVTARARANLADVLRRRKQYDEARVNYEASLAATRGAAGAERSHAFTLSGFGMCLVEQGEYEAAIEPLRAALAVIDPPDSANAGEGDTAHLALAKALDGLGRRQEALAEVDLALRTLPNTLGEEHAMVRDARAMQARLASGP